MSNRAQEFRVGVVALAITGVAGLLATYGVGVSLPTFSGRNAYTIQIQTDRAPGVGPNTPVRKDGVVIGRVVETKFLPTGGVLVTADIEPGAPIYESDVARIRPSSLFGDAVINFAYAAQGDPPEQLAQGAMVQAVALPDPVEALTSLQVDVGPTLESIGRAANSVEELTTRVNNALGEDFGGDQVNSLLAEVSAALVEFQETMQVMNRTMTQIETLASDERLRSVVDTVPALLSDARGTVQKATETLDRFGSVVTSAETNLRNLEGFTEPLGQRGPELSEKLISAVENLDRTLADASNFVTAVTDSRGTLNRLLTDPNLYNQIETGVHNANLTIVEFYQRLRELRPVVHNARVFTDKIAREPGRVISGAIRPEPIVK